MKLHNPLQKTNLEETEMPFRQVSFIKGVRESLTDFENKLYFSKNIYFEIKEICKIVFRGVFR